MYKSMLGKFNRLGTMQIQKVYSLLALSCSPWGLQDYRYIILHTALTAMPYDRSHAMFSIFRVARWTMQDISQLYPQTYTSSSHHIQAKTLYCTNNVKPYWWELILVCWLACQTLHRARKRKVHFAGRATGDLALFREHCAAQHSKPLSAHEMQKS